MRSALWQEATTHAVLDSIIISKDEKSDVKIKTLHYFPTVDAHYTTHYIIGGDGTVKIDAKLSVGKNKISELPRFGMRMILQGEFEKTSWFGRGPFDNYWDRNYAAEIDVYTMPTDSLFHPYARAQESGYRTDVRWISQTNENGVGLMAMGEPTISSGALHFNMNKLDFDRNAKENNHGGSMTNENLIWWNIDFKQMGVGGDNSWGAKTHVEYMLPYQDYQYTFVLKPVYKK
jgi:beta-galactosidase